MFFEIKTGDKKVVRSPPAGGKSATTGSNDGNVNPQASNSKAKNATEMANSSNANKAAQQPGDSVPPGALKRKLKTLDLTLRELSDFVSARSNIHGEIKRKIAKAMTEMAAAMTEAARAEAQAAARPALQFSQA